jgi:hypothetical protein
MYESTENTLQLTLGDAHVHVLHFPASIASIERGEVVDGLSGKVLNGDADAVEHTHNGGLHDLLGSLHVAVAELGQVLRASFYPAQHVMKKGMRFNNIVYTQRMHEFDMRSAMQRRYMIVCVCTINTDPCTQE